MCFDFSELLPPRWMYGSVTRLLTLPWRGMGIPFWPSAHTFQPSFFPPEIPESHCTLAAS